MGKNALFIVVIIFGFQFQTNAQSNGPSLAQINMLTDYSNQNIHGLFIIHRLLELYNQDINQYVDLEGYKLNAFGNGDLPKNIFEDPKKEFYKTETPFTLYKQLKSNIHPSLKSYLIDLKDITDQVNKIRWEVAHFMEKADFSRSENVGKVYEMLEECVTLFDNYNLHRNNYVRYILDRKDSEHPFIQRGNKLFQLVNNILHQIRLKDDQSLQSTIFELDSLLTNISSSVIPFPNNRNNMDSFKRLIKRGKEFVDWAKSFDQNKSIPQENKAYGKFYYYHNYKLLHRVNYSGVGMLYEYNELIRNNDLQTCLLPEIPHFFKVIYPERKAKIEMIDVHDSEKVVELTDARIIYEIPTTLEGRAIEVNQISIDPSQGRTLTFELYDSKLLDGDVVSINFNGDWILENHSLESEPLKMIVNVNSKGKNYFIIHAVNEGSKPPNTVALKYRPKKRKKEILLSCNANTSQLIEIKMTPQ